MRLKTPQGPLVLLPYPVVTVDVGQNLAQMKTPSEIETNWLDYVLELADEAHTAPRRGDNGGHRHPSLCGRHARRGDRLAARSLAPVAARTCGTA